MSEPIINKVAESGLISLDLTHFIPSAEIVLFDIKQYLFMELILKEKDFRAALKAHDWAQYQDQHLALFCSSDAIIPAWAFMLVNTLVSPYAKTVIKGDLEALESHLYQDALSKIDWSPYQDKAVIIKGCSQKPVPQNAYLWATTALQKVAKSLMYGEACSAVPLYKQKK